MQINWKLRLTNKTTLLALCSALIVFAVQVAGALGVELPVTQQQMMDMVTSVLAVLAALGVVVDPTTEGVSDSTRAMLYERPASTSGAAPGEADNG